MKPKLPNKQLTTGLVAFVCFTACQFAGEKKGTVTHAPAQADMGYNLTPADTLKIAVKPNTKPVNKANSFKRLNDRPVLVDYNTYNHSLNFYFLDSATSKQTNLIKEGPGAIEEISGLLLHNTDSIFATVVCCENKLYLLDFSGNIRQQWYVNDKLPAYNELEYDLIKHAIFTLDYDATRKHFTLVADPYVSPEKRAYYNLPLLLAYNIEKNKVDYNYVYYPEFYRQKDNYFINDKIARVRLGDQEFISFPADHSLHVYDANTKEKIVKIKAASKFMPQSIRAIGQFGKNLQNMELQTAYYLTGGRYLNFMYDPYREIFYRLVKIPATNWQDSDGNPLDFNSLEYSIMVLNKKLQVTSEINLPVNIYDFNMMFVDTAGLWISTNNPNNTTVTEDSLQLQLLSLTITDGRE